MAVQTKGLGLLFQASKNSSMAWCRSATLAKEPRRIFLRVNSPNQRSTKFSQLELVGTKCETGKGATEIDLTKDGHWGIMGMYERARSQGGHLSVTGNRGRGTIVSVRMPLS